MIVLFIESTYGPTRERVLARRIQTALQRGTDVRTLLYGHEVEVKSIVIPFRRHKRRDLDLQ